MGQMTRGEIIDQAMADVGYDDTYESLAQTALNAWLLKVYTSWTWPFLKNRASGVSLVEGATSLAFGAGSGGVTLAVRSIHPRIFIYRSDRSLLTYASLRPITGGEAAYDEDGVDPSTFKGIPAFFKALKHSDGTFGKWNLVPAPFPDRDLLLGIDYQEVPAAITSDSTVPAYPNDETMISAVKVWAYGHQDRHELKSMELDLLASKLMADKVMYGSTEGLGDSLQLDPRTFR